MIDKKVFFSLATNFFSHAGKYRLSYLIEATSWVTGDIGFSLTDYLNQKQLLKARISYNPFLLFRQIVHFGSENIFFGKNECHFPHASNKTVLTWFHFSPKDPRLMRLKENQKKINVIHVVTKLAQQSLIEHGIKKEKVVLIPLGIDLSKFKPVHEKEKASLRKQYDLPPERLIIGSFQKDGEGWDEGLTPKLIKGPDVFISVMQNLKKYRPFVLLTGPARGYVKKQLTRLKIDYRHIYAVNINEIAHLYQTLDLYLISSRLEGGPKSIVECLASGVPLVSTRVGMAPDVICDGVSGFLSASENAKALTQNLRRLIDDFALRKSFIINGLKTVKKYDEQLINRQYFEKIYQKLL